MKTINIRFRGLEFSITGEDQKYISYLSEEMNKRADSLENTIAKGSTDIKLLFLSAIMMQNEIEEYKNKISSFEEKSAKELDNVKNNFSSTINDIASYIEHLTEQIEQY